MAYVCSTAVALVGHASVGSGECVALVQVAAHAPLTGSWRKGALVKGNADIKQGTAIATFDANGRYGNHTSGTSHAAIYLSQDKNGIQVIDQWNIRDQSKKIIGQHTPQKRLIKFNHPGPNPVNSGESYFVVE